jgi:DegV family protein with EDD domain
MVNYEVPESNISLMTVKIVTDTASDISPEEAQQLGIHLVPIYVRFGNVTYRDGVDISTDMFYNKLSSTNIHPHTAAPSPGDFQKVYDDLSKDTDEIVSIHVTRKHSSTMESAMVGKSMVDNKRCRIEILDSRGITMWQGMVAIAAAQAAAAGCSVQQVIDTVNETIAQLRGLGMLDTIKYVLKGGRLAQTVLKFESILNVKTILTLREGEVKPLGLVRSWNKGITRIHDFISKATGVKDAAVVYNTTPEDADNLIAYIKSIFPEINPRLTRMGPTMGVHTGQGALLTAIQSG